MQWNNPKWSFQSHSWHDPKWYHTWTSTKLAQIRNFQASEPWCRSSNLMSGWWFKFWLIQSLPNHSEWSNKLSVQTYKKQQICLESQERWKLSREIFLHIALFNHRKHKYLFVPVDFHIKTVSVIKSMLYIWLNGVFIGFVCLNLTVGKAKRPLTVFCPGNILIIGLNPW